MEKKGSQMPLIKGGGKITASHSTMTESAAEIVKAASRLPQVKKISLGEIRRIHGGRRSLKFLPLTAGTKAVVRGNGATQDLYIYTADPAEVNRILTDSFRT